MVPDADKRIYLVGLDFGSTTSSAVFARTTIVKDNHTGRMDIARPDVFSKPEPIFTAFQDGQIDLGWLSANLDRWFINAGLTSRDIHGGGAIVTGLAAMSPNVKEATAIIRCKIGKALIATATDPDLESWLAFMGSCQRLSAAFADLPMINFDIGGGTTNIALGQNGVVSKVGCLWMGARHVQVIPGTYVISHLSPFGRKLLDHLRIKTQCGELLISADLNKILEFYVGLLHEITGGPEISPPWCVDRVFDGAEVRSIEPAIMFSGGVGELIYKISAADAPLPTTVYGDLGSELALAIIKDPKFGPHIKRWKPDNMGRATAFGLALNNTSLSGSTIYLPSAVQLPLSDIPIFAVIPAIISLLDLIKIFGQISTFPHGGCVRVAPGLTSTALVRDLGTNVAEALAQAPLPPGKPIIFLVAENMGKALGSYASDWGRGESSIIIIDELEPRQASFINIGQVCHGMVPVSYFGM